MAGWRERWIAWRNSRLSDARFQRWAADFPLTAPIARRRAQGLFDLVAGFVYAQTLDACVRLDLFERLRAGPQATETLALAMEMPQTAAARLLCAASALQLVERLDGDRWSLGAQGAALLGSAGLIEMIAHHRRLYGDLADGVALLRRGQGGLAGYWPYATSDRPAEVGAQDVCAYSGLMAATLPGVAADLFAAYPIARHRALMDVGGGEGAFLIEVSREAPELSLTLADLPAVTERACARLGVAGLLDRTRIAPIDFLTEPLPAGSDLITLVRILHDHDDDGVRAILAAVRAALPADGTLLIAEPMSAAPRPDRVSDVYFAFYLLAMGRGRARTPRELTAFLREAGFSQVRRVATRTPALLRVLVAHP
jgi:demethylspheroidene O-methyltransferase